MSIGLILLIQTFIVSLFRGLILFTFWFSYILVLIFLGAILILFIYISSLAPNQEFKVSSSIFFIVFVLLILSFASLVIDPLLLQTAYSKIDSFSKALISHTPSWSLSIIYNRHTSLITCLIILYLLLTLIVVVKVVHPFFGPLRLKP